MDPLLEMMKKKKEKEREKLIKKRQQTKPKPKTPKTSPSSYRPTSIRTSKANNKDLEKFKTLALSLAYKYAKTKKRWWLKDKAGRLTLNPNNHEADKKAYEELLELSKKI